MEAVDTAGFMRLEEWLSRTPVVAGVHPLLPLALSSSVHISTDADELLRDSDDINTVKDEPTLILSSDPRLTARFPTCEFNYHPPVDAINANMHHHLGYVRKHLLTTHKLADALLLDVAINRYEIVALLLVDGLSYGDTVDWAENVQPCFVDGPSVTYRMCDDGSGIVPSIGFPSIVNSPSIFARLVEVGYRDALGFTYWSPDSNVISDYLFGRIPTRRVANFEAIVSVLGNTSIREPTYVQIVREGLDGLAHSKRELSDVEVTGAISAIREDVERLLQVLRRMARRSCLYLVADHGILWKKEHKWVDLRVQGSSSRFSSSRPGEAVLPHTVMFECTGSRYYSYLYPYLGHQIRANDSGVHGGLSYQESIVPFAKFEVR